MRHAASRAARWRDIERWGCRTAAPKVEVQVGSDTGLAAPRTVPAFDAADSAAPTRRRAVLDLADPLPSTRRCGAVILGGAHGSLSIARSLGRRGIPVWFIADEPLITR